MSTTLEAIKEGVVQGRKAEVEEKVRAALAENIPPADILADGLIAAMAEVGDRFARCEYYVSEMLVSARAMQAGLAVLKPLLSSQQTGASGKVIIGTVQGDLHDIGKNLVAMMLEGAGFQVVDLGTNVPAERFASAVREQGAQILGLSAMLTTTMRNMRPVIQALEEAGVRHQIKVMIGGAPVTDTLAGEIGADGYAPDATRAVTLAKSLISQAS